MSDNITFITSRVQKVQQATTASKCAYVQERVNSVDKTNLILEVISLVLLVGVGLTSPFPLVFLW